MYLENLIVKIHRYIHTTSKWWYDKKFSKKSEWKTIIIGNLVVSLNN